MREGIKEVIKSDKVNFNGKIAYTSLAVSFKLYQYLFELNKFIKKLSGKQNILYPWIAVEVMNGESRTGKEKHQVFNNCIYFKNYFTVRGSSGFR